MTAIPNADVKSTTRSMKLSIALTTFNGAAYLADQLRSYAEQTRPPDELVVVDDGSTDESVSMVRNFAATAPFPVHVFENPTRLGVTANFEKALASCTGDVLFPSDQDDFWEPGKLERMAAHMAAHPRVLALACNATLIDADGRSLGRDFWTALAFTPPQLREMDDGGAFEVLTKRNLAAGMAMAIRRELLQIALPIPPCWIYDGWLALMAAADGRFAVTPDRLVQYRLHGRNAVGIAHLRWRERLVRATTTRSDLLALHLEQTRTLMARLPSSVPEQRVAYLQSRAAHHEVRLGLGERWLNRCRLIVEELRTGRYQQHSQGWATAAKDLLRGTG